MISKFWTTDPEELKRSPIKLNRGIDIWRFVCANPMLPRRGFAILSDLDYFRQVNDRNGRDFGDAVLKKIWLGIVAALPPKAFAIRKAGESFLVIADISEARLRELCQIELKPFRIDDQWSIFRSVGCATLGNPKVIDDWLRVSMNADKALQEAKRRGGNTAVLYLDDDRFSDLTRD